MPQTLQNALIYYRKSLSSKQIANIAKELLFSIQYIHSKDIVHMNLNLSNVLILRNDPESFFNNDPIDETSDDGENQTLSSNILFINFC